MFITFVSRSNYEHFFSTVFELVCFFFSSTNLLSDEEAQEVARLLNAKDKSVRWQPNTLLDSITASVHDSSGPVSLNDSLGPPSLQEEDVFDDHPVEVNETFHQSIIIDTPDAKIKDDKEPLSQYYESTSSLDLTQDEEEGSKIDASVSATDSGLIGK